MVNEIHYTTIHRVLDELHDDSMLQDVTLEQAVRYALRFTALHGYDKLYTSKQLTVPIHTFRGVLPCDVVRIIQVKDLKTCLCLRSMTDSFAPDDGIRDKVPHSWGEHTFKTEGRILTVSFPEGEVEVSYKALPVDEDGFPMVIDNEIFLGALEAYIRKQVFTQKFNRGQLASGVLQNAQQEYAVLARELLSEFTTPSISEMEAVSRSITHLLPRIREFERGFRNVGDREYLKRH